MKKYLISLDKDSHRRELFFAQANTQDFDVFSAINTMNLEFSELDRQFDTIQFSQHYQRNVTKGEIGCTLSHFSVYLKIVDNEDIAENEYSLICEDDALFSSDFEKYFSLLLEQNLNSDIILLGQSKIEDFNHFELEINYPTTFNFLQKKLGNIALCYPYKNYFAGTVAYLIRKSAARKLVEYVKQQKLYWLADDFILYEKKFGLDIQIIRPLLVIENPKLNSNLQAIRGSESNNLFKKLIKYPLKKVLAIQRNLGK